METERTCRVVTVGTVAQKTLSGIVGEVNHPHPMPVLVGFLANSDPDARLYADWTGKTCVKNGIHLELRIVNTQNLHMSINAANLDDKVDGIMVYYPVFGGSKDQKIKETIALSKDVEGLRLTTRKDFYSRLPSTHLPQQRLVLPTTPIAIIETLKFLALHHPSSALREQFSGRSITIINRSEVVGKPLAALLAYEGACVYSVDVTGVQAFRQCRPYPGGLEILETAMNLHECLQCSDIVVSGVPGERFKVPLESLREGSICVNFSSEKNFDPDIRAKASIFVPSIGPVTIAVLIRNLQYLIMNKRTLLESQSHIKKKTSSSHRYWILRRLGLNIAWSFKEWRGSLWIEYTICVLGVSVGLLSLLNGVWPKWDGYWINSLFRQWDNAKQRCGPPFRSNTPFMNSPPYNANIKERSNIATFDSCHRVRGMGDGTAKRVSRLNWIVLDCLSINRNFNMVSGIRRGKESDLIH